MVDLQFFGSNMAVAELLRFGAPPILILLLLHVISTPELSSKEAGPHRCRVVDSELPLNFFLWQDLGYVEFFSGVGKVSAALKTVLASNNLCFAIHHCKHF